jgi:hypothetical protein
MVAESRCASPRILREGPVCPDEAFAIETAPSSPTSRSFTDQAIAKTNVTFVRSLGMRVIAEGVETIEQSSGCARSARIASKAFSLAARSRRTISSASRGHFPVLVGLDCANCLA